MPKWISAAFALFLSLQVFSTRGATADDVINNYVDAMGGRDMLKSVKTVYSEGVMEARNGKRVIIRADKCKALDNALLLADYHSKGVTAVLAGKQRINGSECFSVKLALGSGRNVNYFIDAASWYIIREVYDEIGPANEKKIVTTDYSDYRKSFGGYVVPFKVITRPSPYTLLNYHRIEVNKPAN